MSLDPKQRALESDVDAARTRVQRQMRLDPDNEVALAMYRADLRRAKEALQAHQREVPSPEMWGHDTVRRYVDGRRVA